MENGKVRIGLVQMSMEDDRDLMLKKALARAAEAIHGGAGIVCLPELYRTRYFPRHIGLNAFAFAETVPGESTHFFSRLAKEHQAVVIVPVYEKAPDGHYYNAAVVIGPDGTTSPPYHKVHIPQDPGFFEKGYFYPGSGYSVVSTPFGQVAVLICYDQWFPEAARSAALDGADIIFYPTAIGHPTAAVPAEGNWQDAWELIQRSHAIANSVHVAAVNRVGTEGNCTFFGGSFVCDAFGKILARAGDREEILFADVDLLMNRDVRESWGFFRNRRPDTYGRVAAPFPGESGVFPAIRPGDTPRNRGFHMPAEWEPHDAVWISWPHNPVTFPHLADVENTYYVFIMAILASERVELFVPSAVIHRKVRAKLRELGADLSKIVLHTSEYTDIWIRDYGPTFVINRVLAKIATVRWNFNAWGNKYENQIRDGKMPHTMNRRLLLPMFEPNIVLEGGSIDVNGRGTVLTTRACLLNRNRNPALSAGQIEEYLREYLGVENVIWLNDGVVGDDTDGHVDDIARFVGPSTVVCAYETDTADANYPALHENHEILRQASDQDGNPLTVIKLPMPKVADIDERFPASYTNFYIGNTVVVVPVFSDPHDTEALHIIQEIFKDRKVVGIDARALVEGYGTFHCATQQQPKV